MSTPLVFGRPPFSDQWERALPLIYDQSHELRSVFSNTMRAENSRRVALRALAFKRMPENPPRNAATGQASMGPIRLTDAQLTAVFEAARPLSVASRDAFLLDLATALQGIVNPGDGDVARAIRAVQRKHFDPPELDERQEPHRRMAKVR